MSRIGIGQSQTFEVDLWDGQGGGIYLCKPATRKIAKAGQPLVDAFNVAVAGDEHDEAVSLMGQVLDLRLSSADGKKAKASTLVKRKWEADEVTVDELIGLFQKIQEASRPT